MNLRAGRTITGCYLISVFALSMLALVSYPGKAIIYIIFTLVLNALLLLGFSQKKIFFDTFIGIFLWLGFWLKLSIRVAFMGGQFQEPVGMFAGTGAAFDRSLVVTTCGVAALILACLVRRRFFFSYLNTGDRYRHTSFFEFYRTHRALCIAVFIAFFFATGIVNVSLGIYQRGSIPRTFLPFGLNGVITWLVLFGLASFSAVIVDAETRLKSNPYLVSLIALAECFVSNVSMLSRGMVLNAGALIVGLFDSARMRSVRMSLTFKVMVGAVFVVLFVFSVFATNHVRKRLFFSYPTGDMSIAASSGQVAVQPSGAKKTLPTNPLPAAAPSLSQKVSSAVKGVQVLVIDRWVGIEGVMAVASYPGLGWDLWKRAWKERFSHSGTSIYDREILEYKYQDIHLTRHHFINIPGILAFLFYPGSYVFLFATMFFVGLLGAVIEWLVYRLGGGNLILCALLAEVIAYRYSHFGYAPNQSYLLFGALLLNVLMIFALERFLRLVKGTQASHR